MSVFRLGFDGIFELVKNEIPWLLWITSIVTWACWGSFLQAVSYRIPNGVSIVVPESHCPGCKKKLLFQDNLPILGWIGLKGKCRFCHMVIPIQYLWVEFVMGILGAFFCWLAFFELNDPLSWLWALMVTSWLMVLGLIDLNHRLLPDGVTLPPLVIGTLFFIPSIQGIQLDFFWVCHLVYWIIFPYFLYHSIRGLVGVFFGEKTELAFHGLYEKNRFVRVIGYSVTLFCVIWLLYISHKMPDDKVGHSFVGVGLALFLLYATRLIASKLAGQEALGLGDVKMAMVLGWWFGPWSLMLILGLACVFGMLAALFQKLRKRTMTQPFGTMMALSAFLIGVCLQLLMPVIENITHFLK